MRKEVALIWNEKYRMYIKEIKSMGADHSEEYNNSSIGAVWMGTVRVQIRFVTKTAEEGWEGKVFQKCDEEIGSIFILNSWPHCFLW